MDIAIADSKDGGHSEVHGGNVEVFSGGIKIVALEDPGVLRWRVVLPDEDPDASDNMLQDHKCDEHEKYALQTHTDFDHVSDVLGHLIPKSEGLDKLEELGDLEDLLDLPNPCEPRHPSNIPVIDHQVEGYHWYEIYKEPAT